MISEKMINKGKIKASENAAPWSCLYENPCFNLNPTNRDLVGETQFASLSEQSIDNSNPYGKLNKHELAKQ
jgi:hypothetical protein